MSSRGGDYGGTYGYEQRLAAAANQRSSMGQPPSPVIDRRSQGPSSVSSSSLAAGSREVQDYAEKKRLQLQRAEEIKRERNSVKKEEPTNTRQQRAIPATPGDIFGPRPNAGMPAPRGGRDDDGPPLAGPSARQRERDGGMDGGRGGGGMGMGAPRGTPTSSSMGGGFGGPSSSSSSSSRRDLPSSSSSGAFGGPSRRPVDRYDDGNDDRGDSARQLNGPPPPSSHSRQGSASSTSSRGGGSGIDDGYDNGRALSATTRPRPSTRETNGPSSAPATRGPIGGSSSNGSGGDAPLLQRIAALEEEVRLLRHQNRLFVNFMEKTDQQLAQLSAGNGPSSRSSAAKKPSNMSSGGGGGSGSSSARSDTGSISSRDGSAAKLKTAEERDPARRVPSAGPVRAANPARIGGVQPQVRDDNDDDDDGHGDHPSDEDEMERRAQLDRAKSAKQREIDRINQRKKPGASGGPPGGPAASSVPMAGGRGGVGMVAGGAGLKSGPSIHSRAAVDEPLDDEDRPLTGQRGGPGNAARGGGGQTDEYDDEGDEDDGGDISFHGGNGVPDDPYGEVGELKPCPHCGRNFTPVNLTRHVSKKICLKKRKVYDMKNKRLAGELKQALVQAGLNNKPSASAKKAAADKAEKKSKWRADRERLQEAIRAGKQISKAVAEGIDPSTLPIAQSKIADDRTPCPHCGRKFAATTAERHIPHCANTKNRPGGPPGARAPPPAKGRR